MLDGVSADRSHAVLDLGSAADSSLTVYSRFARWVRFVDLLSATSTEAEIEEALQSVPENPQRPYDLVFAWDILDRVNAKVRPRLITRLAQITSPDARLYAIVHSASEAFRPPLRFALLDVDTICYEEAGKPLSAGPPILPAELEKVVEPFRVLRAFTTRVGLREYVGVRRGK